MPLGAARLNFLAKAPAAAVGDPNWPSVDGASFEKSFASPIDTYNIFFKPDGTKMFVGSNTNVRQFTLSTAWDVGSTSYGGLYFTSAEDTNSYGTFFSTDGTKFYTIGATNDKIYQYTLSPAWDITTASYDSVSLDISSQDTTPTGLYFKSDGTKFWFVGLSSDIVYQYSLGTPWNLSTASYDSKSFSVGSQESNPNDIFFSSNGKQMWVVGTTNDTVYEYDLSTEWDVSTASYNSISFSVAGQDGLPRGIFFKEDGSKMLSLIHN